MISNNVAFAYAQADLRFFAGRTYHIVGNLMSRLICAIHNNSA